METLNQKSCPFCMLDGMTILKSNGYAVAISDGFPVSPGHTLIIPKRHIASFFETEEIERVAILDILFSMQEVLSEKYSPDGFNIGINEGEAAGQTISHLHIHLIPRYTGDMPDPRGGIRLLFPDRAAYWE